MKLQKVHVKEFKSVIDSNEFAVGNITCLVGKNEAGKTSLLQALYRLNPIVPGDGKFDATEDYPRVDVGDYQEAVETKSRTPATVVWATFSLEDHELAAVEAEFGKGVLPNKALGLHKGYAINTKGQNTQYIDLNADEAIAVAHLVTKHAVPEPAASQLKQSCKTIEALHTWLNSDSQKRTAAFAKAREEAGAIADETEKAAAMAKTNALAESTEAASLRTVLDSKKITALWSHIYVVFLAPNIPKFLYFDEYYQMRGHDNVTALKNRRDQNQLQPSDHPLLGLIELARLNLDQILSAQKTQDLKNKLGGAGAHLTKQVLKYWSQNKHLRLTFDVREGLPQDPEGMREGKNIWGEVEDTKHSVSTGLATRSKGFVWFFSFLAWYSSGNKKDQPLVLLLDEPGLSLHGKAQEDLLRYFEEQVATNPKHQLIYTTHSPFMVDAHHFDRVRIVQDKGIDTDEPLAREADGTKVFSDVLEANPDTLFPLQGALGYEIYQTLFVGPNCLVVEGVSDLLYLQTMSGLLERSSREGLDPRWTITPVGGSDKVPTFVSLLGAQSNLKVATLIDFQKKDQQTIENLFKRKLLKKNHVLTFATFTNTNEADVEDMFEPSFYLDLVNAEYASSLTANVTLASLTSHAPRIVVRLGEYLKAQPMKNSANFSHYAPARRFAEDAKLHANVTGTTLDRFEAAFKALNALLPKKQQG